MARSIRNLLLLAAILSPAVARPSDLQAPLPSKSSPPSTHSYCSWKEAGRPVRRLRDAIIEGIWTTPSRRKDNLRCPDPGSVATQSNFRAQFGGDVVLRFKIETESEAQELKSAADILYLDVWEATDEWVDIRIATDVLPSFLGLLPPSLQNAHTPLMHDLAQTIQDTFPSASESSQHSTPHSGFTPEIRRTTPGNEGRELFFQEYQPLSVIDPWLHLMTSLFPSHVSMITIGKSYEGRDIPGLRVGVHPTNDDEPLPPRKTILITGGSHAREWISITTVNYVAYSIITRYGKFDAITKLLNEYDIVFVPTINPDGYVYSWENDRLWRKNRQLTDLRFCQGVDLDRAFGFEWDGAAARDNPCSESYAGDGPFSGFEAKVLADWALNEVQNNSVNIVAFFDFHSYSQQILYPYAYSCDAVPPSLEVLEEVGAGLAKGFRLSMGHYYSVSSACEGSITAQRDGDKSAGGVRRRNAISLGGGAALDWFYHELGVKYSYQIKLRDTGSYGFLLPKTNIVPTGKETFNAVLNFGRYLLGNKGVELHWEREFIVPTQPGETSGWQWEQGRAGAGASSSGRRSGRRRI